MGKINKLCYKYIMNVSFTTRTKSIPPIWLISSGILPYFPHPTVHGVELHVSRLSCQYVPERPGIHCCSGSGYSFATGLHPALLAVHCCFEQSCLLMPGSLTWISRESVQREGERNAWGEKNKTPACYKTTICLRVGWVFSASQSVRPRTTPT